MNLHREGQSSAPDMYCAMFFSKGLVIVQGVATGGGGNGEDHEGRRPSNAPHGEGMEDGQRGTASQSEKGQCGMLQWSQGWGRVDHIAFPQIPQNQKRHHSSGGPSNESKVGSRHVCNERHRQSGKGGHIVSPL